MDANGLSHTKRNCKYHIVFAPKFRRTVGKDVKKIQEYIQNQLKEDLEYDQMNLKECIDHITGELVKSSE